MFKNYFNLAVHNFLRNRTFSLINLFGLAVGLASVMSILSFVQYELSYDKHYSNAERIYRLVQSRNKGGIIDEAVLLPEGLATTFKKEFPEVEAVTYTYKAKFEFLHKGENISEDAVRADSGFFKVFNLPFIYGNPLTALNESENVVITERMAKTYFPNQNAVGEKLISEKYDGSKMAWTITGVIKDIPQNTHFKGDVFSSSNNKVENLSWQAYSAVHQYILLKK